MNQDAAPLRRDAPLPATPALDHLIERVRARMTRLVVLHGVGTVVAAWSVWLAFAFLADWFLHLPAPVRIFHLLVLVALPSYLFVRELVRPLRARPDRAGIAVLLERAHPGQAELLVSAVELRDSADPSGDREHIERVLVDADRAAGKLDPTPALSARRPNRRAALGFLAAAGVAVLLFANGSAASIFGARMVGGSTPWPQRTHLVVEIPLALVGHPAEPAAQSGELVVRVARGSDVPVIVRAEGEVPEEVVLHFEGGHRSVLGASGGAIFRTVLRSVQEDLSFQATGGDDQDDEPRVRLIVLQPPDVTGVAVTIRPPAYAGLPERTEFDRDVEVLAGSELVVHVLTAPADVTGKVRLLPEDRVIDLAPAPYPAAADAAQSAAQSAAQQEAQQEAQRAGGQSFRLRAERSVRYRFELVDSQGLTNPDPGLFAVTVVEDRAPEVELLSPARGDFDTVAGGLLPLRARAQDDFAVARMSYEIAAPGSEPGAGTSKDLEWRLLTPEERNAAQNERAPVAGSTAIARARLAVRDLAATDTALEGQQFQLVVRALDAAEPVAHEGRSGPLRVRIVAPEEFLRRIQDRLARAQGQTAALLELQREKRRLTLDLLAALTSDAPGTDTTQGDVSAALTGERRVQGDARSLARELSAAAEAVLYAQIDERAGAALEILDAAQAASLSTSASRGFDPEPWRELARAARSGDVAGPGLAGKLVEIAALALEISEDLATAAVDELARAEDATDLTKVQPHLVAAEKQQELVAERLERLLERLAEWDNFQSVLGLTRDILNGQKGLSERTRQAAKEK